MKIARYSKMLQNTLFFSLIAILICVLVVLMIELKQPKTTQLQPVTISKFQVIDKHLDVKGTIYNACEEQCNKGYYDSSKHQRYWHTSDGTLIDTSEYLFNKRICGISRDLLVRYDIHIGDTIFVLGGGRYNGWWYIHDKTAKTYKGKPILKTIDFLINSYENKKYPLSESISIYRKKDLR